MPTYYALTDESFIVWSKTPKPENTHTVIQNPDLSSWRFLSDSHVKVLTWAKLHVLLDDQFQNHALTEIFGAIAELSDQSDEKIYDVLIQHAPRNVVEEWLLAQNIGGFTDDDQNVIVWFKQAGLTMMPKKVQEKFYNFFDGQEKIVLTKEALTARLTDNFVYLSNDVIIPQNDFNDYFSRYHDVDQPALVHQVAVQDL